MTTRDKIFKFVEQKRLAYDKAMVARRLDKYNIKQYIIHDDLSVSVEGSVNLSNQNLKAIPFRFHSITGNFVIDNNEIKSLYGAPNYVSHDFSVSHNLLTSLEYSPQIVGRSFTCSHNNLTSLKGAPQKVGNDFIASHNQLKNLEFAPYEVFGILSVSYNPLTAYLLPTKIQNCYTIFAPMLPVDSDYTYYHKQNSQNYINNKNYGWMEFEKILEKEHLDLQTPIIYEAVDQISVDKLKLNEQPFTMPLYPHDRVVPSVVKKSIRPLHKI